MRIGIEAQRIFRSKKHGMDIVALELIKALQVIDTENEYFIFIKKGDDTACLKETPNFKIVIVPGITYADWEQVFLPLYAKKFKVEILHCTSNTAPLFSTVPTIITLHDVIFLEKKNKESGVFNWYQELGKIYRKLIVPACLKKSRHIVTVSNFEKSKILSLLKIKENRISVIHNSFGKHFNVPNNESNLKETLSRYNLPADYIFYIGNTDPKKNMFNTIKGYCDYAECTSTPLPLVIADATDATVDQIMRSANVMKYRNYIRTTGYITNSDLPFIYAGATLFLYPSLRESFGIPVLESMACGTPVITSNTSALPEIAGNAAYLVDPANAIEISKAISTTLNDTERRNAIIKMGFSNIKDFSWSISAGKLLNIYQSI